MRRLTLTLLVVGAGCLAAHGQTPVWVTPDVPTNETLSGNQMLPWEIWKYDGLGYTPALSVLGNPDLHAIHKMDLPGDWLFSVEAPSDLGGALLPVGSFAEPRDVIWYRASTGTYQLCMAGAVVGIPAGSAIDAIHMDGGDMGDLIVSFDVPTDVTGFPGSFDPADLVRFGATGAGVCSGYAIVAANPDFPAAAAGPGVPISTNADGADGIPNTLRLFPFDVPTDIPPFAGPTAFIPGQIARWNAPTGTWQLATTLVGWPISSVVDGLSCGGTSPGRVDPPALKIAKAAAPAGDIVLTWPGSCAAGAHDYGIYEGTIGTWYSHTAILCNDAPPLLTEQITPGSGSHYYLVVPLNTCNGSEGSYGRCSPGICLAGDERPLGGAVCAAPQVLPTPPACP
jgi:hypothetical protein